MRFLVDQPVSILIARELASRGHDAVHVRDRNMAAADDQEIIQLAAAEGRTIITEDTDFGTLLAMSAASAPSVILLRHSDGRPATQLRLLTTYISIVEDALSEGAIVVIGDSAIRVRRLPIRRS